MPTKDKTGPEGKGPNTGRGLGPCTGTKRESTIRPINRGRGLGLGRGLRAGMRKIRFGLNRRK